MKEIERAIKRLNNDMTKISDMYADNLRIKDDLCIAIDCMQSELDRQENKPLTLEQLKNLTGKKVYKQPKLAPPQEVKINEIFQNNMVEIQLNCGRGVLIDFENYNFYEHKPVEETI